MTDLALLLLRVLTGGLVAGHGSQKRFGWFGGPGHTGASGFMEMLGLRPGDRFATMAEAAEIGGGALTVLGLGGPLGPLGISAAMVVAARTAHRGKPIWAQQGGPEMAVAYLGSATAIAVSGPGRYSLDGLLGIRIPWQVSLAAVGVTAGAVVYTLTAAQSGAPQPAAEPQPEQAPAAEEEAELAGEAEPRLPIHAELRRTGSGRAMRGRVQTP